jgi:hypothetical protein
MSNWSGSATLTGGGGTDTVVTKNDVPLFTLTDTSLTRGGLGGFSLSGISVAKLTGGSSNTTFDVSAWSGSGVLDGGSGTDTLIATNDVASFVLTDTSLARTGLGTLTLASLDVANLTGGPGANSFNVGGWSFTGTLAGGGGTDKVIQAGESFSTYRLSDSQLVRQLFLTEHDLTLSSIEQADVTAASGSSTLVVTGFAGSVTYHGLGGDDRLTLDCSSGVPAAGAITFAGSGGNDLVFVTGAPATAVWTPSNATPNSGKVTCGGATISYSNAPGGIVAGSIDEFIVRPEAGPSNFTLSNGAVTGSLPGQVATLAGPFAVTLDLAGNDTAPANDVLTVSSFPRFVNVSVLLGDGDDSLTITGLGTVDNSSHISLNAGLGADTLSVTADGNFTLSDNTLTVGVATNPPAINLNGSFEKANLTGGAGNNHFNVSGWSGALSVDGGAGTDQLTTAGYTQYDLSDTQLTLTLSPGFTKNIALNSIEDVDLTAAQARSTLYVTEKFTGSAEYHGVGGNDTLILQYLNNLPTAGTFTLFGSGGSDAVTLLGSGIGDATWSPSGSTDYAGGLTFAGARVSYSNAPGGISVSNVGSFTLQAGAGASNYTVYRGWLTSTSPVQLAHFADLGSLTLDLSAGDSGPIADSLVITSLLGVYLPPQSAGLTVILGDGDDYVQLPRGALDYFAHPISIVGGGGKDTIDVDAASVGLTLASDTQGKLTLSGSDISFTDLEAFQIHNSASMTVHGAGVEDVTWTPAALPAGTSTLSIAHGTLAKTVSFDGPLVDIESLHGLTLTTPAGADNLTLQASGREASLSGLASTPTTLANISSVTIDLGVNDPSDASAPVDEFTLKSDASRIGFSDLVVKTGAGDDVVTIDSSVTSFATAPSGAGLQIDAGAGVDQLIDRATASQTFHTNGQISFDADGSALTHTSFENFSFQSPLTIQGTGIETIVWKPDAVNSDAGVLTERVDTLATIFDPVTLATINYSGALTFAHLATLYLQTPAGADSFTLDGSAGVVALSGTVVGGAAAHHAKFSNVNTVTLEFGMSDFFSDSVDTVDVKFIAADGLQYLAINTGAGGDMFTLESSVSSYALPAPGGYFSYSGRDSTVIATSLVDDLGLDFPMLTLSAADGTAEGTLYLGFTTHYRLAAPHVTYTGAGVAEKATWTPSGSVGNAGSVAITPDFGSYQPPFDLSYAGVIGFAHLDSLTLEAPDGEADFTLTAADGVGTLSGAVDGYYATHTATFTQVTNVNIYLGLDSGPVTFDSFAIGSVDVNGLRNLFISTGAGDDLLTLLPTLTSLITPVLGGQVSLDLGTGANVLEATADVGMSLQDGQLLYSGNDAAHTYAGYFTYPHGQIQTAHLTGGAGDNVFHVAWPYSATVDGLGGNDTFYLNGFTGAGTVNGGEGNDLFILQATSARTLDGAAAAVLVDGGAGQDTVFASGDVDYTLTDTALARALPKTRGHALEGITSTFSSIEAATLNGGVSPNVLNAAQFTGTATLIGDGGIDNLIASRGGGALYGYTTALEPAGDNTYTRDNYYLSDGTLDGVVDTIYATNRLGNLVSFRYYRGNTEAGVHFTMPDLANGREQLVTAKGAPDLRVALGFGRVNLLEGSQYADQLYGNKLANIISGLGGDDLLSGIGGDILAGGAGRDRFVGFTPYRYQDLTMSFAGAVVIPSLEPSALHAASLHVSAIQPALAAITRDEFTWLNPVATIVAAVAA